MNCPKCDKEIADDSYFCKYCGEKITAEQRLKAQHPAADMDDDKLLPGWAIATIFFTAMLGVSVLMWLYALYVAKPVAVQQAQDEAVTATAAADSTSTTDAATTAATSATTEAAS